MTNFGTMSSDQLNEWLAVNVMGWWLDEDGCYCSGKQDTLDNVRGHYFTSDWQPTRDLNQAVECVEKLRIERGYLMRIYYQTETKYLVWFVLYSDKNARILKEIWGKPNAILSRALCEAIAMAVEGEG